MSSEAAVIALEAIRAKAKELELALANFKAKQPEAYDKLEDDFYNALEDENLAPIQAVWALVQAVDFAVDMEAL